MTAPWRSASWRALIAGLALVALVASACGDDEDEGTGAADETADETSAAGSGDGPDDEAVAEPAAEGLSGTLRIGAIPDQDPDVLLRSYDTLAGWLETQLPGVDVEFVPVIDYQGAVSGFRAGDLDLVWFGGLTGVQARLEVDGAEAILQRDIDDSFTSVFIARADAGIEPFDDVAGLAVVEGRTLTFGSDSSTSGRLMPQSFLADAGVDVDADLAGPVGFSGSHDATIEVVAAGTYEVGALNSQVWDARVEEGAVDPAEVVEVFRTPEYYDYHWVARPDLDDRLGEGARDAVVEAFLGLDGSDATEEEILGFFGAEAFVPTEDGNYAAIEQVARDIGAIRG